MKQILRSTGLQVAILVLTIIANIGLFVGALVNWTDALRPPFVSACLVTAVTLTVQYLLGKFEPGRHLPKTGAKNAVN